MKVSSLVASRLRRAAGLLPPSRSVDIYPDDTVLVSYPRSGNTWSRFLLANLIHPELDHSFDTVGRLVPDIYRMPARELARVARPRLLKSHEPFDRRYPRVIYVVRDPRDVAVSYFHFRRRKGIPETDLESWVETFVKTGEGHYGTWAEHVDGWISERGASSNFHLIRYEDLSQDTHAEVKRLARFLGASDADVGKVVAGSSADRMRSIEPSAGGPGSLVRKAVSGGWPEELSEDAAQRIAAAFGPTMGAIGYLV